MSHEHGSHEAKRYCVCCGYDGKHAQVGHVKNSFACPSCNDDWYARPPMTLDAMRESGITPDFASELAPRRVTLPARRGIVGLVSQVLQRRPQEASAVHVVRTA
jgi:hypothetical protein